MNTAHETWGRSNARRPRKSYWFVSAATAIVALTIAAQPASAGDSKKDDKGKSNSGRDARQVQKDDRNESKRDARPTPRNSPPRTSSQKDARDNPIAKRAEEIRKLAEQRAKESERRNERAKPQPARDSRSNDKSRDKKTESRNDDRRDGRNDARPSARDPRANDKPSNQRTVTRFEDRRNDRHDDDRDHNRGRSDSRSNDRRDNRSNWRNDNHSWRSGHNDRHDRNDHRSSSSVRFHFSFGNSWNHRPVSTCAPAGWYRTNLIWNSCSWNHCDHSWSGRCRDECYNSPYWKGFRMGECAGEENGYRAGLYGWRYDSDPCYIPSTCSSLERIGFIDGYRRAYSEAFEAGREERYSCDTSTTYFRYQY